MSIRQSGRVARARIVAPEQLDLFADHEKLVREALRPGRETKRYGRVWHVGQVHEQDGWLYGRLGFDRTEGADLWQSEIDDFENVPTKSGAAAPFVVRMADLVVVYQPRKQAIRPTSFVGALRSMLRPGAKPDWRVEALPGEGSAFADWRRQVDQVTYLRFRLDAVERSTGISSRIASLLRAATPESASISWRSELGLHVSEDLIGELLAEAEAGVGEVVAFGRSEQFPASVRRWNSATGDEDLTTEVAVNETGEVEREALLEELAKIDIIA